MALLKMKYLNKNFRSLVEITLLVHHFHFDVLSAD